MRSESDLCNCGLFFPDKYWIWFNESFFVSVMAKMEWNEMKWNLYCDPMFLWKVKMNFFFSPPFILFFPLSSRELKIWKWTNLFLEFLRSSRSLFIFYFFNLWFFYFCFFCLFCFLCFFILRIFWFFFEFFCFIF